MVAKRVPLSYTEHKYSDYIFSIMKPLTHRQQEILTLIREHIGARGFPPTIAEIAQAIGVRSANGVRDHLRALERKGAIRLQPGVSRGIQLLEENDGEESLPVIGQVAAGAPILAEQHIESRCPIPADLFRPKADYLLRVRGMSMRDAAILDGDLVAVHHTHEARDGAIVVARLEDEATVKRLRRKGHIAVLEPENPEFKPIEVDLRRQPLSIEGVVVGVIRNGVGERR